MSSLMALESSCAPNAGPEGSIENMFESGLDLSPPSPRSLSEAAPAYTPTGNYPLSVNSPARFPPPPNSCFPQTYHLNMAFFEGQPAPHQSSEVPAPEPRAPYDHWPERSVSSVSAYGVDSSSKFVSHWPLPSANYIDNSSYAPLTSEPLYPTISSSTQYPLSDSTSKPFTSRFSASAQEYHSAVSPSVAVPSTSFASVSSPYFSSFSPPNVPFDFPHLSSRFSFNPHASAFYPGMYPQPTYAPCSEDFSSYNEPPSYSSHLPSTNFLSVSHQGVDSFHDASSRPMHSPETAPRPIRSASPSFFSGVHSFSGSSATLSNPVVEPHSLPSRSDYCGLACSSDCSGVRESSCDFPPVSSLAFEMPAPRACVFNPYDTTGTSLLPGQLKGPQVKEDDMMERILKESGTLLYHQHISPEEWRWSIYEAQYEGLDVQGLVDLADCPTRGYRSTYNYFQGVDRIGPSCVNEAVGGDRNSLFALSILERSKLQNQAGPSLKLAASALAEMLALNSRCAASSSGQSIMPHIASFPRAAPGADVTCPVNGGSVEAFRRPECLMPHPEVPPDDCCSSSGSVALNKEANNGSTPGGPNVEVLHGPHSSSERESVDIVEHVPISESEFNSMPIDSAKHDASGQSQNSTSARPQTKWLFHPGPQSSQIRGARGRRNAVNEASGGSLQSVSAGCTGANLDSVTSENPNPLFTQSLDVSPNTNSRTSRRVTTQPVGALSSEDDVSIAGPFRANEGAFGPSTSGPCHDVSSSRGESQVPQLKDCHNQSMRNSLMTSTSPPLSQPHTDPALDSPTRTVDDVAARFLASLNWSSPQALNTVHTAPTPNSGFQSLTTSISNLTKVLLATHSSALPQSDLVGLQESLQTAILGLSECLLLEQARLNQQSAGTRRVGLEIASYEEVPSDIPLEISNLICPDEGQANSDRSFIKSSEGGPLKEPRPRANATGIEISPGSVIVDDKQKTVDTNGPQKTAGSKENVDDVTKHPHVGGSANVGRSDHTTSVQTNSSQLQSDGINDILEFLRHQDMANLPALKKLLSAEAREEMLKLLVQDLEEQLEFEREESKGAAFLYEQMMGETDMLTLKLQERSSVPVNTRMEVVNVDTASSSFNTICPPANALKPAQSCSSGMTRSNADSLADFPKREDAMGSRSDCRRKAISNDSSDSTTLISRGKGKCDNMEMELKEVRPSSDPLGHTSLDGVEARLALLRGRPGWDKEVEVPDETESCISDNPCPSDLNKIREVASGSPPLGRHDEQVALARTASRLSTQMFKQSDVLFSMDAAWSKCYDHVGSQYEVLESNPHTVVEEKETRSHTVTQAYDSSLSIEARGLMIRSRSQWADSDRLDSGDENFAGSLDHRSSRRDSGVSGFSKFEKGRFEIADEISFGRHLDSDMENPQPAVARNLSPRSQRENEAGYMLESLGSDTEAVKNVIQSQDSEEEAGWEHVRLPRQTSE